MQGAEINALIRAGETSPSLVHGKQRVPKPPSQCQKTSSDNIPSDIGGFKLVRGKNIPQLSYAMNYKIHRPGRPLIPPASRSIRPRCSSREQPRRPRV